MGARSAAAAAAEGAGRGGRQVPPPRRPGLAGGGRGRSHINLRWSRLDRSRRQLRSREEREPPARVGPAATSSLHPFLPLRPSSRPLPLPFLKASTPWGHWKGPLPEVSRRTELGGNCLVERAPLPAPSQDAQRSGARAAASGRPVPGDSGARRRRDLEGQEAGSANHAAPVPRGSRPKQE